MENLLWEIADIFRTTKMNPNYPYGFSCERCHKIGNKCTTNDSGIGDACNEAIVEYLEKELAKRGIRL